MHCRKSRARLRCARFRSFSRVFIKPTLNLCDETREARLLECRRINARFLSDIVLADSCTFRNTQGLVVLEALKRIAECAF